MDRSLGELETIVRSRVCRVCSDHTVNWQCALEEPSNCALFRLFPQVAQAIESAAGADFPPYLKAIRRDVCSICADRAFDGSCEARTQLRCSLYAYLPLAVGAIREASGMTFDTSCIQPAGGPVGIRPNPQVPL